LESQVLERLQRYIAQYYDNSETEALLKNDNHVNKKNILQGEIKNITAEVERRSKAMRDLYLDKSRGVIDEEQFIDLNRGYLSEKAQLQKRLSLLAAQFDQLESNSEVYDSLRRKIQQWVHVKELSRELVAEFIDTIEVGERDSESGHQAIRINWLF
jgi:hypothetical protein